MAARTPSVRQRVRPSLPATLDPARLPGDDLTGEALRRAKLFDGTDLSARTAHLVDIEGCRFAASSLADSALDKCTMVDAELHSCDLANLTLTRSSMARVELTGCRATGLTVSGCQLRNVAFLDCGVDMGAFRFSVLTAVTFTDCRLQRADFVSADVTSTIFRRCDLTGAELSQVKARGAVFVDCVWDDVRGIASLAGATVVHGSPVDAHAFMVATAGNLGIRLGDPADFPED